MADNLSKRGPQDRARINLREEHEIEYWTRGLDVSREELRDLVNDVGPMAEDVRRQLGKADAR